MLDNNGISRKKILIVEDDSVNRMIMERQLRKYYDIDLAKDGEESLELFSLSVYDLIIMDINLGRGPNGIVVTKKIRETDKGKLTPIIAITAFADFGNKDSFISEGFDNYLSKPYQTDDLLKCIMDTMDYFHN